MSLTAGSRLGPYEIVAPLGAGGMGEVYRARDTRLERTIAIKVLPSHLSENPELKQRFEREAKTISQLSHPHICALYDIGNQDGVEFLVMEYLEGETLADRLANGSLPLEQTLRYATEIADAIARAHRQGIVHRDLKPGNVMLTKSGVKLLDFGLAKAIAPAVPQSGLTALPTVTGGKNLTEAGTILGTFQYMAPEQLEGKEADARSDIFAFGAVLYEMATGRKAFSGGTQASLISSILRDEPRAISQVEPTSPPALDRVVQTCLAKDPEDRWESAGDLRNELKWIAQGRSLSGIGAPMAAAGRGRFTWLAWAGALVLTAVALTLGRTSRVSTSAAVLRVSIGLPARTVLDPTNNPLALSPDGKILAFAASSEDGKSGIWVRPIDSFETRLLTGTEGATCPFWSPDGHFIGFFSDHKLKKVPALGGTVLTICDAADGRGAAWGLANIIVFAPTPFGGLFRVSASGGAPSPLTEVRREGVTHRLPSFLPDGKHVLFLSASPRESLRDSAIYLLDLESKKAELFARESSEGRYVEPGYLAFVRDGNLMVQPMDPASRRLTGEAVPVAENVAFLPFRHSGGFSFSRDGLLVYQVGGSVSRRQLTWFDLDGRNMGTEGDPVPILGVEIAPDDRRAVTIRGTFGSFGSLWSLDLVRGVSSPITAGGEATRSAVWSPDGRQIAYVTANGSVLVKPAEGSSEVKIVASGLPNPELTSWSPDSRFLATRIQDFKTGSMDIWILPLDGNKPHAFAATPAREFSGKFSPDGRWLSYVSDESGREELFVAPFPGPGEKRQVSKGGAEGGWWLGDGHQIAYVQSSDRKLIIVDLGIRGATLEIGASRTVFGGLSLPEGPLAVTHDGKRFLIGVASDETAPAQLEVVSNWTAELRKK